MTRTLHLLLLVFLLLASSCAPAADSNAPQAEKGEIDLSGRNFEIQGPAPLDGEWEFYLCPENAQSVGECLPHDQQKNYYPLPAIWRGETSQGVPLASTGRAVYRLNVLLHDDGKPKCLYLSGLLSTCRVSVNGRELATSGTVGNDAESEKPRRHLLTPCFFPEDGLNEIILEVSNFHNEKGGINAGIRIGNREQIQDMVSARRITGAVTGGALLIMGILHLVIFLARKADRENLYFGLFCIVWCVGTLFNPPSAFLAAQFLNIDWGWYINICLLHSGLAIPLLVLFYHAVFPKKIGNIVNGLFIFIGGSFSLYVIATPPNAYSEAAFVYFLITRTAYLYLFGAFVVDLVQKRKGARYLAPGYLALLFSECDEILFDFNIIHSTDFAHLGTFIFILSYSVLMSVRFAETMTKMADVSEELAARKESEHKQRRMQNRLSKMLDSIEEAVTAVNEKYEINFCNRAFTALTGYRFEDVEGHTLTAFMDQSGSGDDRAATNMLPGLPSSPADPARQGKFRLLTSDGTVLDTSLKITPLDFEEKLYSVVFKVKEKPLDKRGLAVRIMLSSMECWESRGLSKADLAEQSGLWNVYMEKDGYARTQTLDRYLAEETLPARPRWKTIIATAEFIMNQSPDDSPLCVKIRHALSQFKQLP